MQKDIELRKKWLGSFFLYLYTSLYLATCNLIQIFYSNYPKEFIDKIYQQGIIDKDILLLISKKQFLPFLSSEIGVLIFAFATYYFAYKKSGTIWLIIIMVSIPTYLLLATIKTFKLISTIKIDNANLLHILIINYILSIVTAYFLLNCYRLYKVNKAIKEK